MIEYLVCEWSMCYGVELLKARRFTDEEKKGYNEEFRDLGFVSLGKGVQLDEINMQELEEVLNRPLGKVDGYFCGSSNQAYIINQKQWDELIRLNDEKIREKKEKEREERINFYKSVIDKCEKVTRLYTDEEAKQARINYINVVNEGGEGFVPHFYTISEYENAKEQLRKLEQNDK